MYNRYIPQSDGSYRRNRVQDAPPRQSERCAPPPPKPPQNNSCPPPCPPAAPPCPPPKPEPPCRPPQHGSVGGFLQNLLPKDFDTGDLIVVLLLLLMAGDCEEDRSAALLTLALYLFM